jgi:hypothetical protein
MLLDYAVFLRSKELKIKIEKVGLMFTKSRPSLAQVFSACISSLFWPQDDILENKSVSYFSEWPGSGTLCLCIRKEAKLFGFLRSFKSKMS